jgi:hypothetical protein
VGGGDDGNHGDGSEEKKEDFFHLR